MDDGRFDPKKASSFHVVASSFEAATRTATLSYAFEGGPEFVESVTFETPAPRPVDAEDPRLARALRHLHIAAGTSYYKAAAPDRVVIDDGHLTPDEAGFHRHLYDEGLREFAVVNHLPVPRPVTVSAVAGCGAGAPAIRRLGTRTPGDRPRVVVPIGGGKDSLVLAEALRPLAPRLFAVNPHPLVVDLATQAGLELLVVRRRLSPELERVNRAGALNGHVPITAIVSLICVLGATVYGYDTIAMAVERSASEETVMVEGVPVNHQYSKSLEFEQLLRRLIGSSIDADLCYGSALRPYSEMAITRAFAALGRYQDTFCSCNVVFRQSAGASDAWCGRCPKCRFVALMLAPFLRRSTLVSIMGADLLDDGDQVPGFEALMSGKDKPFECVGERRESAAAFRLLSEQEEWRATSVVAALGPRARTMVSDDDVTALLDPVPELAFPEPAVAAAAERFFAEARR